MTGSLFGRRSFRIWARKRATATLITQAMTFTCQTWSRSLVARFAVAEAPTPDRG
jgi:hypothetical protein